jgi:hypothetical protein
MITIFILSTLAASAALILAFKLKTDVREDNDTGSDNNRPLDCGAFRDHRNAYRLYRLEAEK